MADLTPTIQVTKTGVENWDFENFHILNIDDPTVFISADSTLIAAGPPKLGQNYTLYPIGLLENWGMNEQRQLQRIFEIGSSLSYFVVGRAIGALTLGSVFFNGPSLLSALYGVFDIKIPGATINALVSNPAGTIEVKNSPGVKLRGEGGDYRGFGPVTLFSDLFRKKAIGLAIYHKDSAGNMIGGLYFERCHIAGRQFATSAGAVVLAEGVAVEYERSVPIELATATA